MIADIQSDTFVEKHGGDGDTTDSDDIPLAQLAKRTKHSLRRKLIASCNKPEHDDSDADVSFVPKITRIQVIQSMKLCVKGRRNDKKYHQLSQQIKTMIKQKGKHQKLNSSDKVKIY